MPDTEQGRRRTMPPEVAELLRTARDRSGLGLRELARAVGIRHGYLRDLLAGRRVPSVAVAEVLATVLELDDAGRGELAAVAVEGIGYSRPGRVRSLAARRPAA